MSAMYRKQILCYDARRKRFSRHGLGNAEHERGKQCWAIIYE